MPAALQLNQVSAGYHKRPVLEDVSLSIEPGEMVGVLGPNGAGKSTLFAVMSQLLAPRAGTVALFGQDIRRLSARERARLLAVVPQDLSIPVPYTVGDVVMMGRTALLGRWSRPEAADHRAVERALAYTDVTDIRDAPLNELSGGERQRAIVAMALAQEPRIILLDEATSHLDLNHRLEIMQLMLRLNREQGVTLLMISHDLQMAAEFSRRLILLDHGRIVADGTPVEVLTEDRLREVYHCEVRVHHEPHGNGLSILSAPRLPDPVQGQGTRIHVVGGGGCGEPLLRQLVLCGYSVSCGVLNQGDLDAEVATALGVDTVLERPFSPISPDALEKARIMARSADILILSPVPFGTGNTSNLKLLDEALNAGKPVFLSSGIETRDFTPDRHVTTEVSRLRDRGGRPYRDASELLRMIPSRPRA